jgi:hypothetical protein
MFGDVELPRDGFVGRSFRQKAQNIDLTRGE